MLLKEKEDSQGKETFPAITAYTTTRSTKTCCSAASALSLHVCECECVCLCFVMIAPLYA